MGAYLCLERVPFRNLTPFKECLRFRSNQPRCLMDGMTSGVGAATMQPKTEMTDPVALRHSTTGSPHMNLCALTLCSWDHAREIEDTICLAMMLSRSSFYGPQCVTFNERYELQRKAEIMKSSLLGQIHSLQNE